MDLAAFSDRNGAFLVPAFVVTVANKSLTDELLIGVSQVEVDLTLGASGRFSFTVVNTYDLEAHAFLSGDGRKVLELLAFGASVTVAMGYGDHSRLTTLMAGVITEVTTSFSESGSPELIVAGYDNLFGMTLGKRSRNWRDASDSDVVSEIAGEYNLSTDIETTDERHAQIEQNQESDFEFVKKLAERNHFEFYVSRIGRRDVFRFGPPKDRNDGVVTLKWGESLLSFKPEANLAAQVTRVEVYGWDPDKKDKILGVATAGEESGHDPRRKSAGEIMQSVLGATAVLQVRQPVFTEAEAKRRALAILNDHAKRFLTGEAECIGLPDIRPDRNITLSNLGDPFSKTYYIQQTVHKLDGSGYRTRFKVKETTA
jgi:phage protein D